MSPSRARVLAAYPDIGRLEVASKFDHAACQLLVDIFLQQWGMRRVTVLGGGDSFFRSLAVAVDPRLAELPAGMQSMAWVLRSTLCDRIDDFVVKGGPRVADVAMQIAMAERYQNLRAFQRGMRRPGAHVDSVALNLAAELLNMRIDVVTPAARSLGRMRYPWPDWTDKDMSQARAVTIAYCWRGDFDTGRWEGVVKDLVSLSVGML